MSAAAHGNFSKGKRLVIFGCGYVGATVARIAVARGLQVTALTRNVAKADALRSDGVGEVIVGDLAGNAWHERIEGGADYVLNCVSSGGGGIEGYRRSYLEGMTSVVAWLRTRGGAGAAVYTSSTSVYPQDGGATVDENAPTGGEERAQVLVATERTLLDAEDAAAARVVLRLAGIYGAGRHHLLEQVRAGEAAGRPDYHLNLVHRDDIAAAVWAVWGAGPGAHIFNVADDGAATKGEIVTWLAERIGVAVPVFSGVPAGGRRAVTPDRIIANGKLKAERGWRASCPTFREGYEKILSL
ncbi:MAG: NAD-dependent epimerase/dehydratase family protein [Undibacterium sp.]|nr:NAD-dependent epimerase/dehydratase family protein [Opitutaceae bacterium]